MANTFSPNSNRTKTVSDYQSAQLVEHNGLFDSNGVRVRGWPHGIQYALLQHYGSTTCYSTGMMSFDEQRQTGRGQWTGYSDENGAAGFRQEAKGVAFTPVPLPDSLAALWDSDADAGSVKNHIHPIHYTLADRSIPISSVGGTFEYGEGITQGANTGTFRHIHNGVMYYTAVSGVFVDVLDIDGDDSSANTQAAGTPFNVTPVDYSGAEPGIHIKSSDSIIGWPATGTDITWQVWAGAYSATDHDSADPPIVGWMRSYINGVQEELFDFPAGTDLTETTTQIKLFEYTMSGYTDPGAADTIIVREAGGSDYPKALFFHRAIKTNATSGWGFNQLYDASGATAAKCHTYLTDMTSTRMATWTSATTSKATTLGQDPAAVDWVCFGVNDADYTNNAAGAESKASFKASLEGIVTERKAAWAAAGHTASRLAINMMVSPDTDKVAVNVVLATYREAANEIAATDAAVQSIDLMNETTTTELGVLGTMPAWDAADDGAHLEMNSDDADNSYSVLSERVLAAMDADVSSGGTNPALIPGLGFGLID